jgi:hypothetical protein
VLHKHTVERSVWEILTALQKESLFNPYFLVGGTALSLQLGHRISEDIDLFTQGDLDKESILYHMKKKYGVIRITNSQNSILQLEANSVKIDLVSYPYNLLEPPFHEEGIRFLGKKDIAAMKLSAIATSGTRAKDFVDLYYLLKEMPLDSMLDYYKLKYNQNDTFHVRKSLAYFGDVDDQSWKNIRMVNDQLSVAMVKATLTKAVSNLSLKNTTST